MHFHARFGEQIRRTVKIHVGSCDIIKTANLLKITCPEQFGPEPFGSELRAELLTAEGLVESIGSPVRRKFLSDVALAQSDTEGGNHILILGEENFLII